MEDKFQKIKELFKRDFISKNYDNSLYADDFICPYISECNVIKNKEPIYTSNFGEEKSKVMIVAEAPSTSGGINIFISKKFNEIEINSKSPLYLLKNFVAKYYDESPYFTDIVKCGLVAKNEKKMLVKRAKNCLKRYLIEEIKIIDPKLVICVGTLAYDNISNAQKNSYISSEIKIVKIIHYSRQAGLPLNDVDKELIWEIQMGIISEEKLHNISVKEFSYIKKLLNKHS